MPLAKIPDTTTGPTPRAVSGRRSLFGGAVAVVLGGGITAGGNASVADLVPATGPDADLIALCSNAKAIEARSSALMNLTDDMKVRDPRWSPLVDAARDVFAECRESMNRAAKMRAVTLDGLQAKASLALREMGATDFEACPLVFSVLSQLAEGDVA